MINFETNLQLTNMEYFLDMKTPPPVTQEMKDRFIKNISALNVKDDPLYSFRQKVILKGLNKLKVDD